ncbi:1,4-dihydroxy-2-naphthoate polyprenyltransferase [Streptomyces sp. JB150]|uniref:1,4-dihydroxy-2-naphthoate polyprenyltransferase n=1 Tax=Streptomyces sp. JB150 TaxID=2714844 RepID=UPI00140E0649|nr:1,4-dihydroxy-2-naphthoate polyprenyltransferase [Streptomyces sp. JB150]QIJ60696.1 1,4-dihydroxy-2-naphthoate polyprenyltransferase [Streptomyces sp. JB150]
MTSQPATARPASRPRPAGARPSVRTWIVGARPKTLPVTAAPIAVGTGVAASLGPVSLWRSVLTVLFALGFVLGTNFFNDYSDGVRGVDEGRVGPTRLVASGQAAPRWVFRSGVVLYGIGGVSGVVLGATVSWWLLALAVVCALGGWYYTGGRRPYGYRGLGDLGIFLFHGVIAVCATVFIQCGEIPATAVTASLPVGLLSVALLTTNNLRDLPTDAASGKITVAVRLGDRRTRVYYTATVAAAFASAAALLPVRSWAWLVVGALPFAVLPVARVVRGARGRDLIPVLEHTCLLLLVFGALLTAGVSL